MNSSHFYFNVNIWGTVSDWVMIFVTALTAYFIILTFKQQQRLFKNEQYKYKLLIRPYFEAKLLICTKDSLPNTNYIDAEIELKVQNHKLFLEKIIIKIAQVAESEKNYKIFVPKRYLEIGTIWDFNFQFPEIQEFKNYQLIVSPEIVIFFHDIEGNKYQQQLNLRTVPEKKLYVHSAEEYQENKFEQ